MIDFCVIFSILQVLHVQLAEIASVVDQQNFLGYVQIKCQIIGIFRPSAFGEFHSIMEIVPNNKYNDLKHYYDL